MFYKIRCLVGFSDFSILSFVVKQGHELTVSENVYKRLISSGGKFQVIEIITPPHKKEVEKEVEVEVEKEVEVEVKKEVEIKKEYKRAKPKA